MFKMAKVSRLTCRPVVRALSNPISIRATFLLTSVQPNAGMDTRTPFSYLSGRWKASAGNAAIRLRLRTQDLCNCFRRDCAVLTSAIPPTDAAVAHQVVFGGPELEVDETSESSDRPDVHLGVQLSSTAVGVHYRLYPVCYLLLLVRSGLIAGSFFCHHLGLWFLEINIRWL